MTRALFIAIALSSTFLTAGAAPPAAPAPSPAAAKLPSQADIQKAFDAKDYEAALEQITRVLPLKGDAAKGYDRYDLFMLKGEAHLGLKQIKSAGDAFAAAVKETEDADKAALARATQRVLRESRGGKVQRRVAKRDEKLVSADFANPDQRQDAFRIAYDDARAAAEPKVKAALQARSLPEIADGLKLLGDLRDLEVAATGGDGAQLADRQALGDRATKLMERELDHMQNDVIDIRENANQVVRERIIETTSSTGRTADSTSLLTTRRGLSMQDKRRLTQVMQDCKRVIETSQSLAKSMSGDADDADPLVARATEVGRMAERVSTAKY